MSERALNVDVAIVGGGLAGLACAVALQDSGLRVALFEAGERLGGRAASWPDAASGDVIDVGPHIFLSAYRNTLALLELLGTRGRIVWETDRLIRLTEERHATDMRLHALPPPFHLAPGMAKVRSLSARDKLSNLRPVWLAMRMNERSVHALDRISAADFLHRQGVSRRFTNWFWATACMTVMNVPLERCSAGALMRVFSQLIGQREYRIGFAGCPLAELFVPGAERVVARGGGLIHLNAPVTQIIPQGQRVSALVANGGTHVTAKYYVAAVPPKELQRLTPQAWLALRPFCDLGAFEPSPYVSNYLWFDRKLSDLKFWSRVWRPEDLNSDFYDLSNIRPEWKGRPSVIASNIIYSHRAAGLDDAAILARTREEIVEALPSAAAARVQHAVVNRIQMAVPCPLPGMEDKRPSTLTPIDNLLIAGDWAHTLLPSCMESAVCAGWSAAETIWRSVGRPKRWVQPVKKMQGLAGFINRRWGGITDGGSRVDVSRPPGTNHTKIA